MPRLQKSGLVLLNETRDLVQFVRPETQIRRQSGRCQPVLRQFPLACHVHVRRLGSVAREEKEPIRTALENGSTHVG